MRGDAATAGGVTRHKLYEDLLAILLGAFVTALGLTFYAKALLITSSLAGLSLLVQYASGQPFWVVFSLLNAPFYVLAVLRMGWAFAARTLLAVSLVSMIAPMTQRWVAIEAVDPAYAALMGGALSGLGLLVLFRHRTGLGGINILALLLQEKCGIRSGWFQLAVDLLILVAAVFVLPSTNIIFSVIGAVTLNGILVCNHKPGRYLGVS